jgi:hypothetical protein
MAVRPPTVFSFEHFQEAVSQSQSHECPVKTMLTAKFPFESDVTEETMFGQVKNVQS